VLQASPGKRYEPETSDGLDCNGGTSSSWGRCPAFGLVKCFPVWYCYRRHRKNGTARDLRALGHPVTRGPTQGLTMELTSPQQNEPFKAIIDRYERAFLERDLAAFRTLHVRDGRLVFFDNHSGCDSASYEDHEVKIAAWSTKSPRSARSSSTSRYDSEKRKYQPTASRIISGSNWRHLNRPATEGARTISAQLIKALLQSCNTSREIPRQDKTQEESALPQGRGESLIAQLDSALNQAEQLRDQQIQQQYSDQLGVYVQEKAEQIDRLQSSLAAVLTSEQAQLQAIQQRAPGWTAGKKAHAQWEQQVARRKTRIAQLALRLDRVGEIEEAASVYAERKIEELAERKLRFDNPELVQEWIRSSAENGRHRFRPSRALKASARTLGDH